MDNNNNQTTPPFEVFRPNGCTYDVLAQPNTDPFIYTPGYSILSHYGFYKGTLNENKVKNGRGTFIFSNSIYTGQWNLDKKEGEGTLILCKPIVKNSKLPKSNSNTAISKLSTNNNNNNSSNSPTIKKSSPINLSPRLNGANLPSQSQQQQLLQQQINEKLIIKLQDKFQNYEEIVSKQKTIEYLQGQDFYRGKWISGKANGIGVFHFAGDDSSHCDFWRSGVVIRYANQSNILKPNYEDSLPALLNSKEIIKEMIEDWKKLIGQDDDFPCARPYLSTPTTTINLNSGNNSNNNSQQSLNSNNNNNNTSPSQSPSILLSPTHIPLSPPRGFNSTPITSISSSVGGTYDNDIDSFLSNPSSLSTKGSSPISSSLQHSKTQPNVQQSQNVTTSTPSSSTLNTTNTTTTNNNKYFETINQQRNQQRILKQQLLKLTTQKQSFGVITANYLKNRIENEDKFFMSLILFISKWEIPFKSFNIPNNYSTLASFLIFIPDTDNCTFISLSNLIMQSNILEKLMFKLLIDPISKQTFQSTSFTTTTNTSNSNNSTPNKISPSTSSTSVSLISGVSSSSTMEERELFKLLPVCLELNNDNPQIERECITSILNLFKFFPSIDDYSPPQFIPDTICNLISCFKKTKSLENYLLAKQFQMSKDYFFKSPATISSPPVTSPPLPTSSVANNTNSQMTSPVSPLSQSTSSATSPPRITSFTTTSNNTTTTTFMNGLKTLKKGKPTTSNTAATTSSTSQLPSIKQSPVTSPPGIKPTFSVSLTTSNKIDLSTTHTPTSSSSSLNLNYSSNNNKYGTIAPGRRQTLESIFPAFKQQSNTDLLQSLMASTSLSFNSQSTLNEIQPLPELNLQSLNVLFNQFKLSYQFPESLSKSIQYLSSTNSNMEIMKKVIKIKLTTIQDSKPKSNELNTLINNSNNTNTGFKNYLILHDQQIETIICNLKNDLLQLDNSWSVTIKLYKELVSQQISLCLSKLKIAHLFIHQLLDLSPDRISGLQKDFTHRFIKHSFKIINQLATYCNSSSIGGSSFKFDFDQCKDQVNEFITNSSDLYSKIPSSVISKTGVANSPSPTNQSPQLTSISTSVYEYFLGKKNSSSSLQTISPTSSQTNVFNIGQQSNNFIRTNPKDRFSLEFESSDITPGPFSFISPLDKIPEEIMSGHYQLILPVASSGDELLVSVLSNGLIDLRSYLSTGTKLKDMNKSSLIQLFNILLHSTIICHNITIYIPEVFKTLIQLVPFYPKKDELFIKYKQVFNGFMELCIRDDSNSFSSIYLTFLSLLIKPKKKAGLGKELKKEFVQLFPIQLFIDLMERPIVDATNKNAEKSRASSAQILINLAISSSDYLLEIKNKNALGMILDVCKLGQAFAHTKIEESELEIREFLGEGALAKVHKGIYKGKEVAVKIFNEGSFSFRLEDFLKEVAILGLFNHPNLLKLKGACIAPRSTNSTFMIVTELMQQGTLENVIQLNKPLNQMDIIKHALSVAQGLEYLHSVEMIHRDIKAANILVDAENNSKVGDFGLSRVIDSKFNMTAVAGTPKWESPECLMGEVYTSASDVYSFGMLLFELAVGQEPYCEITTIVELVRSVCDKKIKPKIPSTVSTFMTTLIKDCLNHSPKKRPTMSQIIQKLIHESNKKTN